MAATRSKAAKAEELRISQIGDFKSRLGGIMELPSGLIVRAKNPGGLRVFMSSGVIPNSLMVIIQKGMKTGQKVTTEEFMPDGKIDDKMMNDMNILLDAIATKTVVEPKIWPALTDNDLAKYNAAQPDDQKIDDVEELRRDDRLYVDELPEDDKQFLFQWISGGTRDLEEFRRKLDGNVDALARVAGSGTNAGGTDGSDLG